MDTESRQEQVTRNVMGPPVDDHVVADTLLRRWSTRARPVPLATAISRVREMQERDDVRGFDAALIELAAAALNTASTVRRNFPSLIRRSPR